LRLETPKLDPCSHLFAELVFQLAVLALLTTLGCQGEDGGKLGVPPGICSTHAVSVGESPQMEPGGDCISCHASGEGPSFLFAGTVMAALNDDTNCSGVAGVTVRITGADGNKIELLSNGTGTGPSTRHAIASLKAHRRDLRQECDGVLRTR